jgi:hypothetical protein
MAIDDAKPAYDEVNRFSYGHTTITQLAVEPRSVSGERYVQHLGDLEAPHFALDPGGVRVVSGALQNF